jgi:hypothetical protein
MYSTLKKINTRPAPFETYTVEALWTDPHTSAQMLSYHLNEAIDVYSLAAYDQREVAAIYERNQLDGLWSASDYSTFVNIFKYDDAKVVLDKYTVVEENRTREVNNWLQYLDPERLEEAFRTADFEVEGRFGDVAGSPFSKEAPEFAIVARKPKLI